MEYKCDVCGQKVEGGFLALKDHTEDHIVDIIKKDHPQWVDENGVCVKCLDHYRKQLKGE